MRRLGKFWFLLALVLGLTVSFLLPGLVRDATHWLRPQVVIALALFLMAWTMPARSLWGEVRRPWAVFLAVAMSYAACPLLAWLIGPALSPDIRLGVLLSASVPCTLASAVLWTRLAGGNEATALLVTLSTTLTGWLVPPAWLHLTTGALIELPVVEMMLNLVLTLVVPVTLGQLVQAVPVLALFAVKRKVYLGVLSQLFILAIILQASANVGERINTGSASLTFTETGLAILIVVSLHLTILGSGWKISSILGLDRPRCLAVAFSGSQKTLPVALLLYETYFQASYPLAIVPVLAYHVGQLLVDTPIAAWLREE